jgi:hypothetical protein
MAVAYLRKGKTFAELAAGFRTLHVKRPCQALSGRRVVDHFMSVFRGCFGARSACPRGLPVPAGWVRAVAAGRARAVEPMALL